MKSFVINLARAEERRRRMERRFASLGLEVTFHPAVDGRELGPEHYAQVDRESRRRLGLWPQADGSIANWISQRQVMREIVENGPETVSIFEDDANLSADLPEVLYALECRPFAFDMVKLNRRSRKRTFVPCECLTTGHQVGRLRYHDYGSEGYVLTRDAARHFLANTSKMIWEIDQALSRFWENGLNVFYLDPPIVSHDEGSVSQIEGDREHSRQRQRHDDSVMHVLRRRMVSSLVRKAHRRLAFRRLMRGKIGVTPY